MSGEVWYSGGPENDVFPETFGPFLLGNDAACARSSCSTTPICSTPSSGSRTKERIRRGQMLDVSPTTRSGALRQQGAGGG